MLDKEILKMRSPQMYGFTTSERCEPSSGIALSFVAAPEVHFIHLLHGTFCGPGGFCFFGLVLVFA